MSTLWVARECGIGFDNEYFRVWVQKYIKNETKDEEKVFFECEISFCLKIKIFYYFFLNFSLKFAL
jgi:hypothetical protein